MYDENKNSNLKSNTIIPSKTDTIDILNKLGLPRHIINHVMAVSRKAIKIATEIQTIPVDLKIVRIGALLHDIGRTKSHGFDHASVGGDIIRELGWSEKLARIAETHILGGITQDEAQSIGLPEKDYMPKTIEEKIVCLSDKYHIGAKKVTIEHRFRNWINRFGNTELLQKSKRRVEDLELDIYKLMYP